MTLKEMEVAIVNLQRDVKHLSGRSRTAEIENAVDKSNSAFTISENAQEDIKKVDAKLAMGLRGIAKALSEKGV